EALRYVADAVPLPLVYATDEALLYATERGDRPLVLLAGHLDTVPAQDNLPGRIEEGFVVGLGASDMKGGCAVMIELARWAEAEARLRELVAGELEILSNAPPAHVAAGSPLVQRLRAAGGFELQPKQAWTPVAEFAAQGLDAVNLGPGATRYAHRRDERVEIAELERTFSALRQFAAGG